MNSEKFKLNNAVIEVILIVNCIKNSEKIHPKSNFLGFSTSDFGFGLRAWQFKSKLEPQLLGDFIKT